MEKANTLFVWKAARRVLSLLLLVAVMGMASCAPAAAPTATPAAAPVAKATPTPVPTKPTPTPELATVKVGVLRSGSEAGFYVAIERGYFREQGITNQLEVFRTATDQVAPLSKGDLDVGTGAITAGLFNAFERGIPLVLAAGTGYLLKGSSFGSYMVRKDLWDAGVIRTPADLKGKVFAKTPVVGSLSDISLERLLKQGNVSMEDIRVENLGFPEMAAAFAGKKIDFAYMVEPYVTQTMEQGLAVRLAAAGDLSPGQMGGWMFSPQFAKDKREVANRWTIAMLKGGRDHTDAFFKNKGGKEEIATILAKYTAVTDPAVHLKTVPSYITPNGYISRESLQEQVAFYTEKGWIKVKIDANAVIDDSFVDHAIGVLGKYEEVAGR